MIYSNVDKIKCLTATFPKKLKNVKRLCSSPRIVKMKVIQSLNMQDITHQVNKNLVADGSIISDGLNSYNEFKNYHEHNHMECQQKSVLRCYVWCIRLLTTLKDFCWTFITELMMTFCRIISTSSAVIYTANIFTTNSIE